MKTFQIQTDPLTGGDETQHETASAVIRFDNGQITINANQDGSITISPRIGQRLVQAISGGSVDIITLS